MNVANTVISLQRLRSDAIAIQNKMKIEDLLEQQTLVHELYEFDETNNPKEQTSFFLLNSILPKVHIYIEFLLCFIPLWW